MRVDLRRMRHLLSDAVTLLCKNGLQYNHEMRVEGVIGITLDNNDVLVVHINEAYDTAKALTESPPEQIGSAHVEPSSVAALTDLISNSAKNDGQTDVQMNHIYKQMDNPTMSPNFPCNVVDILTQESKLTCNSTRTDTAPNVLKNVGTCAATQDLENATKYSSGAHTDSGNVCSHLSSNGHLAYPLVADQLLNTSSNKLVLERNEDTPYELSHKQSSCLSVHSSSPTELMDNIVDPEQTEIEMDHMFTPVTCENAVNSSNPVGTVLEIFPRESKLSTSSISNMTSSNICSANSLHSVSIDHNAYRLVTNEALHTNSSELVAIKEEPLETDIQDVTLELNPIEETIGAPLEYNDQVTAASCNQLCRVKSKKDIVKYQDFLEKARVRNKHNRDILKAELQSHSASDEDRIKEMHTKMLAAKRQQRYRNKKKATLQTVGPTHTIQRDTIAKVLTPVPLDEDALKAIREKNRLAKRKERQGYTPEKRARIREKERDRKRILRGFKSDTLHAHVLQEEHQWWDLPNIHQEPTLH